MKVVINMKIVNPFGKTPIIGEFNVVVPDACICNAAQAYHILEDFGFGSNCACGCFAGKSANNAANHETAYNYNY